MAAGQPELRAIGVDVGATRVRAGRLRQAPDGLLELEELACQDFSDSGFVPLSLTLQGDLELPPEERQEAERRSRCILATIQAVRGQHGWPVGLAAPGRKSADGRSVIASRLGPRLPGLADFLEQALGVPIGPLGSDGVLAGVGEERARAGSFRGIERAYYLGAGTGLAEAVKTSEGIGPGPQPPLYELRGREGRPFEDLVAARVWPNPRLLEDLLDLLRSRQAQLNFQRVVLGGHFRSALEPREVSRRLGVETVLSALEQPAVFGAAALALGECGLAGRTGLPT